MTITQIEIAPEQQQSLDKLLSSEEPLTLAGGGQPEQRVTLPEGFKPLLKQILAEMARGGKVRVLAEDAEITLEEAARHLKVSPDYLLRAINRGEVPARLHGDQPRLKLSDVQHYELKLGRIIRPATIKMRDMSKDMKWLSEHRREYAGKWVAVYEDLLIASGENANEVHAVADRVGLPQTLITFIEEPPSARGLNNSCPGK